MVKNDSTITAVVGNGGSGNIHISSDFGTDTLGTFIFLELETITSYPNPGTGSTVLAHPAAERQAQLQLIDINGRTVKTIVIPPKQVQTRIDLSGIKPGIYRVVWSDGQRSITNTILVQ